MSSAANAPGSDGRENRYGGQSQNRATNAPDAGDDPRVPVWCALSDLYLDTDVSLSYAFIAETLAHSPYSLDTLYAMLMDDVHPALYPNLMQVAGEWAGFDREWLLERIAQVQRQPRWRRRLSRLFVRSIRDDWRRIAFLIAERRTALGYPSLGATEPGRSERAEP